MKLTVVDDTPLATRLLTAGTAACIADFATFPLDTAKVRLQVNIVPKEINQKISGMKMIETAISTLMLQVQGEAPTVMLVQSMESRYHGMMGTLSTIARQEGVK